MDPSPSRVRQIERESVDMDPLSMIFDTESRTNAKVETSSQQQEQVRTRKRRTLTSEDFARTFLSRQVPSVPVRDVGNGLMIKNPCNDLLKCRELSGNGQWTALLNVAQRALAMSSIYGDQRAEIRIHEVRAFIRMQRYNEAEKACDVLESGKEEKDLPFGLRVLKAELPQWVSKHTEGTLSSLRSLLSEIEEEEKNSSSSSNSNDKTIHETLRDLLNSPSCLLRSQDLSSPQKALWRRVLLLLLAKYSTNTKSAVSFCLRLAETCRDRKSVAYADAILHAARILIEKGSIASAETLHKHLHSCSSKPVLESVRGVRARSARI